MFYSYNITVTPAHTELSPKKDVLDLSAGIIHQVDILFPSNSTKNIYVRIFHGGYQLIPTNRLEAIRADNTIISTREFFELPPGNHQLVIHSWNTHATDSLLVSINIGLLPKNVMQPFSFEELLKAALGEKI